MRVVVSYVKGVIMNVNNVSSNDSTSSVSSSSSSSSNSESLLAASGSGNPDDLLNAIAASGQPVTAEDLDAYFNDSVAYIASQVGAPQGSNNGNNNDKSNNNSSSSSSTSSLQSPMDLMGNSSSTTQGL